MSQDIVQRLEYLAENTTFLASRPAIREAAEEIASLRSKLANSNEVLNGAIREMGKYAHQSGYYQGTLQMIERRLCDPAKASLDALERFGDV
jgi:hypothetical protein